MQLDLEKRQNMRTNLHQTNLADKNAVTPQQLATLLSQLSPEEKTAFFQSQGVRFVPRPRVGVSTTRNNNKYLKVGSANLMKSNRGEGYLYWGARGRGAQPLLFNAGISKAGNSVVLSTTIEVNPTEAQMCRDFFTGKDVEVTIERREYKPRTKGEAAETPDTESAETESETETESTTPAPKSSASKADIIKAMAAAKVKPTKDNIDAAEQMVAGGGVTLQEAIALLK